MRKYLVALAVGIAALLGGCSGSHEPATGILNVGSPGVGPNAFPESEGIWTQKVPMPTARANLAVGVVNNILYAVGGTNGSRLLNTVEAYDPATNTWTAKASMSTPRWAL